MDLKAEIRTKKTNWKTILLIKMSRIKALDKNLESKSG